MGKNKDASHDEHRPNVGLYVKIFGALMVLTLITVAISKVHLPRPQAIGLGVFVALIKAGLVGAIFMHLWGEAKLVHKILWVTAAFATILVINIVDFSMLSHKATSPMSVADQHPGGHGPADAHPAPVKGEPAPAHKGH